jgi:PHS family inorganic phosphate transporter-like MFS transporter
MLMAMGSFLSGLSFGHTAGGVMATLCFFRFWLGVGIGGDYPLSATIMAEYASKRTRGAFVAAVFAMEGFSVLAGCIVTLTVSATLQARSGVPAYEDDPAASTPPHADYAWRIVLMAGAIPACFSYRWRKLMPETARYTALVARDAGKAARDMSRVLEVDITVVGEPSETEGSRDDDCGVLSAASRAATASTSSAPPRAGSCSTSLSTPRTSSRKRSSATRSGCPRRAP